MPEISHSDSLRSDTSLKPRVSFNRNVHVKRIGLYQDKYATLPVLTNKYKNNSDSSLSSNGHINVAQQYSTENNLICTYPRRKLVKSSIPNKSVKTTKTKSSSFDSGREKLLIPVPKPQTNIKLNKKIINHDHPDDLKKIKRSPYIKISPSRNYSSYNKKQNYKENFEEDAMSQKKVFKEEKLDNTSEKKNFVLKENRKKNYRPEIVIIDVDKAENIYDRSKKKFNSTLLKNKINIFKNKKKKDDIKPKEVPLKNNSENTNINSYKYFANVHSQNVTEKPVTINYEYKTDRDSEMFHKYQKPSDRVPQTKGRTVDKMIKRLNAEKSNIPPRTNITISPSIAIQHNNNQPFSYTQPSTASPERSYSYLQQSLDKPPSPIIYAHVVVENGDPENPSINKQTVHTVYNSKKMELLQSDSDEGLGCDESLSSLKKDKSVTHFGDEKYRKNMKNKTVNKISKQEYAMPINLTILDANSNSDIYRGYSRINYSSNMNDSNIKNNDNDDSILNKDHRKSTELYINEKSSPSFGSKPSNYNMSDLSYRRNILESKINSRRIEDKTLSYLKNSAVSTQSLSRPYINDFTPERKKPTLISNSPVYFSETNIPEKILYNNYEKHEFQNHSKYQINEDQLLDNGYENNDYENTPVYQDKQENIEEPLSEHSSTPKTSRKLLPSLNPETHSDLDNSFKYKTKVMSKYHYHYMSNPEIQKNNDEYVSKHKNRLPPTSYHDSLQRQKNTNVEIMNSSEMYNNQSSLKKGKRDRLGDSGIENDLKRDYMENRNSSNLQKPVLYKEFLNDSEDEGFASSLLIASERRQTDDNKLFTEKKIKSNYDSDREIRTNGVNHNHNKNDSTYKKIKTEKSRQAYVHRERSIDDGSHFDPRIDKNLEGTLKREQSRPPKPIKKSGIEKVKSFFSRDPNKKIKKTETLQYSEDRKESLRSRHNEYRGSDEGLNKNTIRKHNRFKKSEVDTKDYDYSNRKRASTPSSIQKNFINKKDNENESENWYRTLENSSYEDDKTDKTFVEEKSVQHDTPVIQETKSQSRRNLRFFGDTDLESNNSLRYKKSSKSHMSNQNTPKISSFHNKGASQSTRDLYNISEKSRMSENNIVPRNRHYKSMQNIRSAEKYKKDSDASMQSPASSRERTETSKLRLNSKKGKKKNEVSSLESSTEGESSQQSQSIVYLHTTTVGDIPGPEYLLKNNRRPKVKTLSRSFSVLAPWKPRHHHEGHDIDYTSYTMRPLKTEKNNTSSQAGSSIKESFSKQRMENQKKSDNLSSGRKYKSKENVSYTMNQKSNDRIPENATASLYRKREKTLKENKKYNVDEKKSGRHLSDKNSSKTLSRVKNKNNTEVLRSISLPRDPSKSAGWFGKLSNKNEKASSTYKLND